jgi:hypothetical protein
MKSDGDKIYIKIIELDKIWNFVVDKIFVWDHLGFQIYKLSLRFFNSNFWISQMTLDGEMSYMKVVVLEEI